MQSVFYMLAGLVMLLIAYMGDRETNEMLHDCSVLFLVAFWATLPWYGAFGAAEVAFFLMTQYPAGYYLIGPLLGRVEF